MGVTMRDLITCVGRGLSGWLGAFALLNLLASWRHPGFDPNLWWVDVDALPEWLGDGLLGAAGFAMLAFAIRPICRPWRKRVTLALLFLMAGICLVNGAMFYAVLCRGAVRSSVPLPVSFVVAASMSLIAYAVVAWQAGGERVRLVASMGTVLLAMVGLPLLQMLLYGATDYRRPADAILVFGARVYADGTPSLALSDRVATACDLYRAGLAPVVIMSGGPGDGRFHETEVMERLAVSAGVPSQAIQRDEQGLNTAASVRRVVDVGGGPGRVLAVSHSWHLPRIKLAAGRQAYRIYTVPCRESRPLGNTALMLARETVAFWKYYLTLIAA